jgi:uncharacterized membrane protein YtjA (UPF0391 family)
VRRRFVPMHCKQAPTPPFTSREGTSREGPTGIDGFRELSATLPRVILGAYDNSRCVMFNWAVIFLVVALVAGVLGFTGIAGTATQIAWILFVVGIVMAIVFFLGGRRPPSL